MARKVAEIQAEMDAQQALQSGLNGLNSPSQSAIYTLWKYIISYSIFVMETLWDKFQLELETTATNAPIGTNQWVQSQVFKFQFSSTTPQIIQLINFVPGYNPVDQTLQIITRCSSLTKPNKIVDIKVAKSEPPEALSIQERTSLVSYLDQISFAGVQYNVISLTADKLYLDAEIFYDGQYTSVIQSTVIAAIDNYLSNIPFDGIIKVSALEDAIQSVVGVKDIVIAEMALRADAQSFSARESLVFNKTNIDRNKPTYAGYIVGETTSGHTFLDKLTFTIGN